MTSEIKQQLEGIFVKIPDTNKKKLLQNFFETDVEEYLQKMFDLEKLIIDNKIPQDKAYTLYSSYSDYLIGKMADIEVAIDKKEILKKIKQVFRKQADNFINKIFLLRWGYNKPSGHPGDYKLIEMLYNNEPLSKGLSFCGDKYLLKDSYVQAIRIRKDIMKDKLIYFIENSKIEKMSIMNLGCGSCREISEIFENKKMLLNKKLMFTLIDWDKEALDFSKKVLDKYSSEDIKFNFVQENIVNLHKTPEKYSKLFGKQDLIYSIGLVDYLPSLILGDVINFCFNLLNEKGILTLAHKNVKVHKSIASDWFCDWLFFPRSKEDMMEIIEKSLENRKYKIKISEDKTKHIFFIDISNQ